MLYLRMIHVHKRGVGGGSIWDMERMDSGMEYGHLHPESNVLCISVTILLLSMSSLASSIILHSITSWGPSHFSIHGYPPV